MPHVRVARVSLFGGSIDFAVEAVIARTVGERGGRLRLISATGAHGIVHANEDPSFMELLNRFYMNLPDGMPGVWVGRLKGAKQMERCYGPDFFAATMRESADLPIRHYLCGGKEGVAEKLREACADKFGNRSIVGTHCPPFRELSEEEFQELGEEINALDVDLVWIGISTPKQEWFAHRLSKYARVSCIATVGAAFDFHIGAVRQAPAILQKMGLEWFFRLVMEPRRLYMRYLKIVPKFVYLNLRELAQHLLRSRPQENPTTPNREV